MKTPDFIVVGTIKHDTNSLFRYLLQHSENFLLKANGINYFARSGGLGRVTDNDQYFSFFRLADEHQEIGEVSADYIYNATAITDSASCLEQDIKTSLCSVIPLILSSCFVSRIPEMAVKPYH